MARLAGKTAIITGAASGMGLAGAHLFAQEGANVVVADIVETAVERAVSEIREQGLEALGIVLDVTSQESWAATIERTVADYGTVDVLVNNAGIHMTKGILEAELDDWNRVLAVNTTGVWLGMKSVIPIMQDAGHGSIVNISSISALVGGFADGGGAAYSASKGAVRSLTKHAAQHFAASSIRVNSIHPGPVFTGLATGLGINTAAEMAEVFGDHIPLPPHVGEGDDIGYAMLYLASDEAKYVTGSEFVIDGGWTTR
jgi:NAD(P)-dependent dehydrogenase (short-subunit alcohol dehydrogenase family)